MNYGDSEHYRNAQGVRYFLAQNSDARIGAKLKVGRLQAYVKSTDAVLDFGCAGGWVLHELDCAKRVGVEVNLAAHPQCSANGVRVYGQISDVPDRDFDVIITSHCLEHVSYPIAALRELHALLKADGVLVVVLPMDDWRVQRDYSAKDMDHHLHTWTPRLIANTLDEAGFITVNCQVVTHALFPKYDRIYRKIPCFVFNAMCNLFSVIKNRRELFVVARRQDAN